MSKRKRKIDPDSREARRDSGSAWAKFWKNMFNDASSVWPFIDTIDECMNELEVASQCDAQFYGESAHDFILKIKERFPIPETND